MSPSVGKIIAPFFSIHYMKCASSPVTCQLNLIQVLTHGFITIVPCWSKQSFLLAPWHGMGWLLGGHVFGVISVSHSPSLIKALR